MSLVKGKIFSANEKQKLKLKRNALDYVDITNEKKLDPKYKTEMCKSWTDTGICVYANKCRFAHGKNELFEKPVNGSKYKQKDCNSFRENGFCVYGSRCNFRHEQRKINQIDRSYYVYKLTIYDPEENKDELFQTRLRIFEKIAGQCFSESSSLNTSTSSKSPAKFNYVVENRSRTIPYFSVPQSFPMFTSNFSTTYPHTGFIFNPYLQQPLVARLN
jgi:hypothetical protein